jgi:hypothetical protein
MGAQNLLIGEGQSTKKPIIESHGALATSFVFYGLRPRGPAVVVDADW